MENSIMKTTSAETKKISQSDRGDSSTSTSLDENLWGTLQHHIDLAENVYPKLPFEEFFQLRRVCKDWYVIACNRLGLKEPIHKPFFTLFSTGEDGRLDGILIYNALSRSWDWRPSIAHNQSFAFVASEGVVFSADCRPSSNYASIYHWQSNTFQRLDPPPIPPSTHLKMILGPVLGVIISEKQGSFSLFRIVCGSQDFDTRVYESGVWQTKPCRVPKLETGGPLQAHSRCVDCNGRVYITAVLAQEILVYDFEKARWSTLLSPGDWDSKRELQHYCPDTLGVWNSRIFDVTSDFESGPRKENWSLQVWELVDETLHKWQVYDCMPKGLWLWLQSTTGFLGSFYQRLGPDPENIFIEASFCGDFMLVYSWDHFSGSAGRFCLFNMATKNWQKLNIATGAVRISPRGIYQIPMIHLIFRAIAD